jgi:hypothetical protein
MKMEQHGGMEGTYPRDESSLPHLASVMYFRLAPKSRPPPSFRESMIGPTPRRMAAVSGVTPQKGHNRRASSIPRPTSKLTARRFTPPRAGGTGTGGGTTTAKNSPETIVKPRTYSRTRPGSYMPGQTDTPSSFKTSRAQPPRPSLPATTSQHPNGANDLSGIHQQLPMKHYYRHSLASLDAMMSSPTTKEENKTTTSLPLPNRLTKSNTSSSITKVTSPVIPQRQLMGPLGPPMPRNQTIGNLGCFAGSVGATPSPSKSTPRTVSIVSQRSEVGVMDALAESRMTEKEIQYFNQVAKEVEANRQRMKGGARYMRLPSNDSRKSLPSSKTMTSFTKSNSSSDNLASVYGGDFVIGDSSRKLPFKGRKLKILTRSSPSMSPPILTPDSGVSMGSDSEQGWEINPKLVSGLMHGKPTEAPLL